MTVAVFQSDDDGLTRAAEAICAGGVVGVPTETVYGLAGLAKSAASVERIFSVKARPANHPLIVHIATLEAGGEWFTQLAPWAIELCVKFWPGPLTIVAPKRGDLSCDLVTGSLETVALRVPNQNATLELIRRVGALAAPSANRFGSVSPTRAQHVVTDLGPYMDPKRDGVVDGGQCSVGIESTIVDVSGDLPVVLRPGLITPDHISKVAEREVLVHAASKHFVAGQILAPGMAASHYAPKTHIVAIDSPGVLDEVVANNPISRIGYFGPQRPNIGGVYILGNPSPYNDEVIAPKLYEAFREADSLQLDVLCVVKPSVASGQAVLDRLSRASHIATTH